MTQWAPDDNLHDRVERLKRERAERCARGQHDDPDNSGMCINCGVVLYGDDNPTCTECGGKIDPDAFASVTSDLAHHLDTNEPYHWSCLQEAYERERLADGEE